MGIGRVLSIPLRAMQRTAAVLADRLDGASPFPDPGMAETATSARDRQPSALHRQPSRERNERRELLRRLEHGRATVRAAAAREIGLRGYREATALIERAARDKQREVRRAALGALLQLDAQRFADAALDLSRRTTRAEILADLDALSDAATWSGPRPQVER